MVRVSRYGYDASKASAFVVRVVDLEGVEKKTHKMVEKETHKTVEEETHKNKKEALRE